MAENIGRVIQIAGPAVDVQFAEATLPPIYQAVRVVSDGFNVPQPIDVILGCSSTWARDGCAASPCSPPTAWCAA